MFVSELSLLRQIASRLLEGVIRKAPIDYFYRVAKDLDNLIYSISKNSKL